MDRLLLTLALALTLALTLALALALAGLGYTGMLRGRRRRQARQSDLPELYLPRADVTGASVEKALAGKVTSSGMLVVTWRLGDLLLASAFRADDHAAHTVLRDAVTALLPVEAA